MNLRQLKEKIKSVKNVGQITRAMQLVSAIKMKKAQARAISSKPYRDELEKTIANIAMSAKGSDNPLTKEHKGAHKDLVIVISSNKGLCGVFNFNLFKFIHTELGKEIKSYDFLVLGIKVQQFLVHYGANIIADFSTNTPFEDNVTALYRIAKESYEQGKYRSVSIVYNKFISSLSYKPTRDILLPLTDINLTDSEKIQTTLNYVIEPSKQQVLESLLSFYIESKIRGAVFESIASEHSARMVAMKNATDNVNDLVHDMTLMRNSLRQEHITNELLDMNTARLAVSS